MKISAGTLDCNDFSYIPEECKKLITFTHFYKSFKKVLLHAYYVHFPKYDVLVGFRYEISNC
jgi:hypothetical protein